MLRPFQVNEGRFLPLEQDLLPTARVSELCSAVKAVSNEAEEDQVMLTSEGKQMDPAEMIGAYSVGTESKPIFVFYRSYLTCPHPPSSPSSLPHRGELKQQLELLHQKPTPSLFQKMVILAKRLSEHVVSVGSLCGQLSEEYQLQYSGWCTALANCDSIVRTYQKHHQLFSKEVETFRSTKPEYLQLLQEFPEKVELLQQLPMPSTLQDQNQNPASSLYDWISTHDERNSLLDLSRECKKALSNLDSSSIDAALLATHQVTEEATKLHSQDDQFHRRVKELTTMAKKTTELTDTTMALAQNIQSTSERARRYGDAGTIADLVVSHHRSLQMMSENCSQLESQAKEAEQAKAALTKFIHTKLRQVAKLQERVAYSNSQLLLLHEHIKLARKRFEVLRQVCHTPQVLAHVLSEVDRRTAFNSALEKRAEEVSIFLKQAREEEKQLRRSFVSNYGQHFIATLFPELVERVPDVSIHLPRSLSKSSQLYHSDLEQIRQHLPLEMRPSPASASVQLLSSPLLTSLAVGNSPVFESAQSPSANSERRGDIAQQLKESSAQTGGSLGPNEEKLRLEGLLQQLEAANSELSMSLSTCVGEREHLKQQLEEKDVTNRKMVTSLELDRARLKQELALLEGRNRELSNIVNEKERLVNQLESVREGLLVRVEQAEEQSKQLQSANHELEQKVQLVEEETKALSLQISSLSDEKECHASELKQKVQEIEIVESRYNELSRKYESKVTQLQGTITELNRKLGLQSDTSKAEITQLQERVSQLESTNKQCLLQRKAAETELSEMKTHWEEEKSELESKLTRISTELQQCRTENETLTGAAGTITDTLQLREREISQLRHEVQEANKQLRTKQESLLTANQELEERCKRFEGEHSRQELRHQQAQSTISDLKGKMEAAESKARDYQNKLEAAKKELSVMQDKVQSSERKIEELQSQNSTSLMSTKAEKAKNAQLEQKIVTLQEKLKIISSEYEEVKKSQQEKVQELEQRLKKEIEKYDTVKTKWEEADSLAKELLAKQNSAERQLNEKAVELESITTERNSFQWQAMEYEVELKSITDERDFYHRQAMEYERDLRELKREIESPQQSLVASPSVSQSPRVADPQNLVAALRSVTVSIASIKDGDIALFINDSYGNYLALAFDKIYYLNDGSVQKLNDLSSMVPRLDLKRRILIGKVTGRMYVEVRKEANRLKVPVGTRMYKIDAEPILPILISATTNT